MHDPPQARTDAARVFLFDEPNSALTDEESDELFRAIHKLAGAGNIVILDTHRLGDLAEHTARVAVVRDGRDAAALFPTSRCASSAAKSLRRWASKAPARANLQKVAIAQALACRPGLLLPEEPGHLGSPGKGGCRRGSEWIACAGSAGTGRQSKCRMKRSNRRDR